MHPLVDILAALLSQKAFQHLLTAIGKVPNDMEAHLIQLLRCSRTAAKKIPHLQRPHLLADFLRVKGMHPVRFLEITGHLCQKFILGNTDIHGKAEPAFHCVLYPDSQRQRLFPVMNQAAYIQICLINGSLLNLVCVFLQNRNEQG